MAFDFKKEYKELYLPPTQPVIVEVPEMKFFMVKGKGNPNTSPVYKNAVEILYGLSYAVKMSKKSGKQPEGYFDYTVLPLEGFWWSESEGFDNYRVTNKEGFCWISMIRQPDFVTEEVYQAACAELRRKKPGLDFTEVSFGTITEGLCAQMMHLGSYDEEPDSIRQLDEFIEASGYVTDIGESRFHHEIYLKDPGRTKPENLKTVLRHPIRKK